MTPRQCTEHSANGLYAPAGPGGLCEAHRAAVVRLAASRRGYAGLGHPEPPPDALSLARTKGAMAAAAASREQAAGRKARYRDLLGMGLSREDAAAVAEISPRTAHRYDLELARVAMLE